MRVFVGEPGAEHKETLASASEAAAAGGVTCIIMQPNTEPVIDDVPLVEYMHTTTSTTYTHIHIITTTANIHTDTRI